MVLIFYVDDCLVFSPSKGKIYEVYASIQEDFNIEDYGELSKYLRINLDRHPDGSIHIGQPYLTQRILNMIPGMDKSSSKPTSAVKPPLAKIEGAQTRKKYFKYRSVIGLLTS